MLRNSKRGKSKQISFDENTQTRILYNTFAMSSHKHRRAHVCDHVHCTMYTRTRRMEWCFPRTMRSKTTQSRFSGFRLPICSQKEKVQCQFMAAPKYQMKQRDETYATVGNNSKCTENPVILSERKSLEMAY